MELFATITIFISVLGASVIFAIVWLVYKWNTTKRKSNTTDLSTLPPLRKLIVVRGKVIPATSHPTPSIKSTWSSIRHPGRLLSSLSLRRSADTLIHDSRYGPYHGPLDAESALLSSRPYDEKNEPIPRNTAFSMVQTRGSLPTSAPERPHLHLHLEHNSRPPLPRHLVKHPSPRQPLPLAVTEGEPAAQLAFSGNQYWISTRPHPRHSSHSSIPARSFSEVPLPASLQSFPKPPYLAPLQSKYQLRSTQRHIKSHPALHPPTHASTEGTPQSDRDQSYLMWPNPLSMPEAVSEIQGSAPSQKAAK